MKYDREETPQKFDFGQENPKIRVVKVARYSGLSVNVEVPLKRKPREYWKKKKIPLAPTILYLFKH